jgi:tetratricopeptide (TPR) repeat protein
MQRIDPALAEQLTGNAKAGQMLERMSRDHFFTQKYGQAYQYHPLFREFLQDRAQATLSSADIVAVQRKAAELMEQSGGEEEAVGLYIAAADWSNAERVALKQALALVAQGRSTVLEGWLNSFPNEHIEASPWALYWLGICRLAYNPAEARGHLEQAFLHFQNVTDVPGMFLTWASVIDTFVYEFSHFKPLDHWIAVADQLLAAHPEFPSPEIEARFAAGMLNALSFRQPHRADLHVWAERVRQIVHHHPSTEMRISLGISLLLTYQWVDDFAQAGLLLDVLRPLSGLKEIPPFTRLSWYLMEAGYYWVIADHATCMKSITNGLSCAEESGIHLLDWHFLGNGVYSGLSLGDPQAAETCLQKMASINSPRLMDKTGHLLMVFSVAWYHGNFKKAIVYGRQALTYYEEAGYPLMIAFMHLELAEALFDDGQVEEACSGLAQAWENGHGINAIQWLYGLRGAKFAFARGEEQQGLDLLKQGMALGAQQGYLNMPRWNNRTMSRLCAKALEHGIETEYVQRLIRLRGLEPDSASRHLKNWPWGIRIHALGQFSVTVGDEPLRSSGKQQRKPLDLLQLLVSAGERGLPVEQVVEALWPDLDGDKAYSACTSAVYRLRKLVGSEDAILTQEGRVALNPQRCYVDAWAFEHLKERARRAANPEEAAPCWRTP